MPQVFLERSVALSGKQSEGTRAKYFYYSGGCSAWTPTFAARASLYGGIVESMLGRVLTVAFIASVVLLSALLQTTAPTTVGPLGILIVFILMYMSVLGALTFLLYGISKIISKLAASFVSKKSLRALSLTRSYYFSSVVALAPVIFIGMQSVGQVGFYDVLLVVLFVVIACIYIAKRTA